MEFGGIQTAETFETKPTLGRKFNIKREGEEGLKPCLVTPCYGQKTSACCWLR